MELKVQKDTPISLHQQLLTQLSVQITAGLMRPGQKLPSIRSLARKLEIHPNTCLAVYKELAQIGLVEIRQGSGVRVLAFDKANPNPFVESDLAQMAGLFVQNAVSQGFSLEDITQAIEEAKKSYLSTKSSPVVFVDEHADILPVFKAELEHFLDRPVSVKTFADFDFQSCVGSHFIVSRYHYGKLEREFSKRQLPVSNTTLVHVGNGHDAIPFVKEIPEGSLVTILSASAIILRQSEAVITALRGNDLLIRPALLQEEGEQGALQLIKRSKVVFVDFVCYQKFQGLVSKPLHLIRVLPDCEVDKIKSN